MECFLFFVNSINNHIMRKHTNPTPIAITVDIHTMQATLLLWITSILFSSVSSFDDIID